MSGSAALGQCAGCGQAITERGVEALGQRWHAECFKCDFCGAALQSQCLVKYGRPYCAACERRLYGEYCDACDQPIASTVTHALGKTFHAACFVCARCKGPLAEGYAAYQGQPYCKACANAIQ